MTDAVRLCLVGLPDTGKTTYIAALWAYVNSSGPPERYHVVRPPGNAKYLTEIADAWVRGQPLPRNDSTDTPQISFGIGAEGQRDLEFALPDLRGEVFKTMVTKFQAGLTIIDLLTDADVLLFVVSAKNARTFGALAEVGWDPPPEGEPEPDVDLEELDSDFLNTELLQKLCYLYAETVMPPVVVVISAWDRMVDAWAAEEQLAEAEGREPQSTPLPPVDVLAHIQPEFAQRIAEVARASPVHIIGLSSTGGDPEANPALLEQPLDERPYSIDGEGVRTHIDQWLVWFAEISG